MMLRAGVIGMGVQGKRHARVWDEMSGVELFAVADPDPKVTSTVNVRPNVLIYSDYRMMLRDSKFDLVSVVVPTALHSEVVIDSLQAGCNVLVEKPIAMDRDEARGMMEVAKATGKMLTVGHIERFNPAIQELKRLLPDLGHIFEIHSYRSGPFPKRILDVGVVVDLAPHDLDMMRFLTRSEPIRVYAEMERRIIDRHEDCLAGVLRFANGTIGTVNINWLSPAKFPHTLTVIGDAGAFTLDYYEQNLSFFGAGGGYEQLSVDHREPLLVELEAFAEAVAEGGDAPVSAEDATIALLLSQAMMAAARYGSVISGSGLAAAITP